MNPPAYNRWLITGTLTTLSELHIGDGETGMLRDRASPPDWRKAKEVASAKTVCVDTSNHAFIPGSALKGPFRQLALGKDLARAHWNELLGKDDTSLGGKLAFFDAFRVGDLSDHADDRGFPFWDPVRRTCATAGNAIERRTRTASDQKLHHLEYVPAEEVFTFRLGGECLTDEEVTALMGLLRALEQKEGAFSIGGLGSKHWGRIKIEVNGAYCLAGASLAQWLSAGGATSGFEACRQFGKDRKGEHTEACLPHASETLRIQLDLVMDGPWLTRDPDNPEKSEKNPDARDARGLRDEAGRPMITAKSFIGALRSQAERILRTIGNDVWQPWEEPGLPKAREEALKALNGRSLSAILFGFADWKAPVEITRLILKDEQPPKEWCQEFNAIDRFTGGGADKKKFNAKLTDRCTLSAELTVDLDRLRLADPDTRSIGLLALVLRDLEEGDIPLGAGRGKGQGCCHLAEIAVSTAGEETQEQYAGAWKAHPSIKTGLKAFFASPPETTQPDHA